MTDVIDLSNFFTTKSQANDFSVRLSTVIDQLYTANFNLEKSLSSTFGIQKADMFLKLLREQNLNLQSTQVVQDFLKKIQETVSGLSIVTLVIAFEPSDETLQKLSQWFIFNLNKQVLFDIQVDTRVIAGVKITYNGKFKDYSLGALFNDLVKRMLQPVTPSATMQHVMNPQQTQSVNQIH